MSSTAELSIKVTSQGLDEATTKMDKLSKSGEKAGISIESLAKSQENIGKSTSSSTSFLNTFQQSIEHGASSMSELVQQRKVLDQLLKKGYYTEGETAYLEIIKKLAKRQKELNKEMADLGKASLRTSREFDSIVRSADPLQAKLRKLEDQAVKLHDLFDAKKISPDMYYELSGKLNNQIEAIEKGTGKLALGTKSARTNVLQLASALKNNNFTSAARNIAELGGSSNVSATSMLRLAAPIGLVTTALGTLGYAYYKAEKEAKAFRNAIYLSGSYSGINYESLNKLSANISGGGISRGDAATALAEITKKGKFTEEQLKKVATTALQMKVAFAIPIAETISKFEELGDAPSQSILKLNEQYHFLTTSVYEQVRALELQGDRTAAANLAMDNFAQAQQIAAYKAVESAGFLERAWQNIKMVITDAIDEVMNLGRGIENLITGISGETIGDRLASRQLALEKQINDTIERRAKLNKSLAYGAGSDTSEAIKQTKEDEVRLREQLAKVKKAISSLNQQGTDNTVLKVGDKLFTQLDNAATPLEKMRKELKGLHNDFMLLYQDTQKTGKKNKLLDGIQFDGNSFSGGAYDKLKNQIIKQYQTRSKSLNSAHKDNASTSMLQNLRQQEAVLRGQLATTEKLGSSQEKLIKFEKQIADLKEKKTLTADQKKLLIDEDKLRSQHKLNVALEREVKLHAEVMSQKAWSQALNDKLSVKQGEVDLQSATVWMGTRQAEEYRELINVQKDYARQKLALARNQDTERALTKDTYEKRIQELDVAMAKEVDIVKRGQAQKREAEENWLHGANASYQNYLEEARNVSKQTESLFTNAFGGMEDALVSFVRNGKLSFSDFANAILDDLARIGVRMATSSALEAVFSGMGGLFSGGGSAPSWVTSAIPNLQARAKGAAYSDGIEFFAKGSAFTNSIVNTPTPFQFAKGGVPNLGVMGEAGDEAIMPLTRTSNGDLGVRAIIDRMGEISTSGSSGNNIQVYVTVDSNGNTETTTSTANQSGQDLATLIDSALQQWATKEKRQGGILNPNNRRNQ